MDIRELVLFSDIGRCLHGRRPTSVACFVRLYGLDFAMNEVDAVTTLPSSPSSRPSPAARCFRSLYALRTLYVVVGGGRILRMKCKASPGVPVMS